MNAPKNNFILKLFINGEHVPLKPFLRGFVSSIILGLVANLKDIPKPKKVELKLEEGKNKEVVL